MRRLIPFTALEMLAVALVRIRATGAVLTDEAKYLLNIPYPHPPLVRWIMQATEAFLFHELLWRFIFASLLLQGAWLVSDMGRSLRPAARWTLVFGWLLSTAILLQAGAVLLSSITALWFLLFLWCVSHAASWKDRGAWIALLWMACIFTSYQGVLIAPMVFWLLKKAGYRLRFIALFLGAPILLLVLYTLTNPFALAAIAGLQAKAAAPDILYRLWTLLQLVLLGGGGVFAVIGIIGMLRPLHWPLLITFTLLCAYIGGVQPQSYYAIFFTPLYVAGGTKFFSRSRPFQRFVLPVTMISGIVSAAFFLHLPTPSPARAVVNVLAAQPNISTVLIDGPFGHEWQYEAPFAVRRFKTALLPVVDAVICTQACPALQSWEGTWERIESPVMEVWVRKK